jgi:hypothetical protein
MANMAGLALLKSDRIRAGVQSAILEAELDLLGVLSNLIEGEIEADGEALAVLEAEQNKAVREKEEAEKRREYGIAAGEMLLNDSRLTQAAIEYLWDYRENEIKDAALRNISSVFAEKHDGKTLLAASACVVSQNLLADLRALIGVLVQGRMRSFTITDALVALDQIQGLNIGQRLSEALKQVASLSLLAPSYENVLNIQTFASLVYAPSALPKTNKAFERLLSEALKPLNLNLDRQGDHIDSETLLFYCEFFAVPLSAFAFFDEWGEEFDKVKTEAKLNPHPDLHR